MLEAISCLAVLHIVFYIFYFQILREIRNQKKLKYLKSHRVFGVVLLVSSFLTALIPIIGSAHSFYHTAQCLLALGVIMFVVYILVMSNKLGLSNPNDFND